MILMTEIRKARAALDELVGYAFDLPSVEKAKAKNILAPQGFDAVVIGLLRELQGATEVDEAKAIKAFVEGLDKDWPNMSAKDRERAVSGAAKRWLGLAENMAPKVGGVLEAKGKTVVEQTKAAVKKRDKLRIEPSFNLVDEAAVKASASMQALYVRDALGRRQDALSDAARKIVSSGLERGLDRYDMGKELKAAMVSTAANRSENYFRMIASVFVARARTFSTLTSYQEAGITAFQYEAVLDEVTTEVCRFMHGKTFQTGLALARYADVAASEDPEAVKELQPWVSTGKTEDGGRALFYKSGGERQLVARVDSPGAGRKDGVGSYSRAMSPEKLQAAGMATPPLHGHCRSTIVPVFGSVQVIAPERTTEAAPQPAPTIAAPPPPPPPPPPEPTTGAPLVKPPEWTTVAFGPDGLPRFVDKDGNPVDLKTDVRPGVLNALERVGDPDGRKYVLDQIGRADPKDQSAAAAAFEAARKKSKTKSLEKLLEKHGEITQIELSLDPKRLLAPANLDPNKIAAHVARPNTGTVAGGPINARAMKMGAGNLPVLVKHGGKVYVHEGAEIVAAQMFRSNQGVGGGYLSARVIDLDAIGISSASPKLDAGAFAKKYEGALAEIAKTDAPSAKAQREVREGIRELLASHGIVTRDDRRGSYHMAFPLAENAGQFEIKRSTNMSPGAAATHDWSGRVLIGPKYADQASKTLTALAKNPKRFGPGGWLSSSDVSDTWGFRTLVHEEIHGASAARAGSYSGAGVGMEEAATEILARKVTRELFGHKLTSANAGSVPLGLPTLDPFSKKYTSRFGGSYDNYIETLFNRVGEVAGHDGIHERIENALLATRQARPGETWDEAKDQVHAFVDELGIKDAKQRKTLAQALMRDPNMRSAP